jgi:hypothetical protein
MEVFRAKWRTKTCWICGTDKWELQGYINFALTDGPGAWALGGPSLPCVAVICKTCGNTVLINAVITQIVSPALSANAPSPAGPPLGQ